MEVTVVQGDITTQQVDAVVNAANHRMRGGGGVDGAIHRAGGPAVLADCERRFPAGWRPATRAGRPRARCRDLGDPRGRAELRGRPARPLVAHVLLLAEPWPWPTSWVLVSMAFRLVSAGDLRGGRSSFEGSGARCLTGRRRRVPRRHGQCTRRAAPALRGASRRRPSRQPVPVGAMGLFLSEAQRVMRTGRRADRRPRRCRCRGCAARLR